MKAIQIERDPESEAQESGIRLATMHRLKGLEYARVFLASVQEGLVPFRQYDEAADGEAQARYELQERCLLYVACTRARDELVIAGYGEASRFLPS